MADHIEPFAVEDLTRFPDDRFTYEVWSCGEDCDCRGAQVVRDRWVDQNHWYRSIMWEGTWFNQPRPSEFYEIQTQQSFAIVMGVATNHNWTRVLWSEWSDEAG